MATKAAPSASSIMAAIKPSGVSLACLSPDLSTLIVSGANGLITCYSLKDTCSFLRVIEDPHHLTRNITCLAWGDSNATSSGASTSTSNQPLIAAGCFNGNVVLYDFATGSFKQTLGSKTRGHTKKVTDIVFSRSKQFLFTSSMDGTIIQWNLQNGQIAHVFQEQAPVRRILLTQNDSQLISADSSIRIYDVVSRKVIHKISGHSSNITALATTPNGKYLLSATRDEIISLWSLAPSQGKTTAPIANFMSQSGAREMVAHHDQDKNVITVYALSHYGAALVWNHDLSITDVTPVQAKVVVRVEKTDAVKTAGIFAFKPIHPSKVCLAYGDFALPRYSLQDIMKGEKYLSKINLRIKDIRLVTNKERVKELRPLKDAEKVLSSQKHMVVEENHIEEALPEPELVDTQNASMSFGQQIVLQGANMASEFDSVIQVDQTACNVIASAIQSKNKILLEKSISQVPVSTIEGTVKALPVYCIPPLISALGNMLQMNYTMTHKFNIWITSILTNHSSYLIASPNLVQILSNIYQLIDERLSSYQKMKQLSHKLTSIIEPDQSKPKTKEIRAKTRALIHFDEAAWLSQNQRASQTSTGDEVDEVDNEGGVEEVEDMLDDEDGDEEFEDDGDEELEEDA